MKSSLQGQLRNFSLPWRSGLVPLFEAVVNSIHAIEERFIEPKSIAEMGKILVTIKRDIELPMLDTVPGRRSAPAINGFDVTDNGIGFNKLNWASFNFCITPRNETRAVAASED